MEIVFACAGGVFVVLILAYLLISFETWKHNRNLRKTIIKLYSDENLAKMEYDLAFYGGDLYSRLPSSSSATQVTIDELLGGDSASLDEADDLARFKPIDEETSKVIVGHYDPEAVGNSK